MLNVESASAVLLAVLVFGEDPGFREAGAAAANLLGVVLLPPVGEGGASDMVGAAAIAGACLSWTIDNNLTQRLSQRVR